MAALPRRIGRYRVQAVIGTGGFATVYRAVDEHLDVEVAVKVLAENHSLEPDVRQRFIEEGRRLRRVRSPHVVAVHDLGDTERAQPYLVLDLADRGDLAARVAEARDRGHLPGPDDLRAVAAASATALDALHRHRIVHRDLAPKNLLLWSGADVAVDARAPARDPAAVPLIAADEQLILADLGLSKDLSAASGLTVAAGTSGFAPPEQRRPGGTVDHRADIWAASALIVWLLTDRPPDDEGRWQNDLDGPRWPPETAQILVRALARGLAERPDDRYPDIREWRTALEAALQPPSLVATAGLTPGSTPNPTPGRAGLVHRSIGRRLAPPAPVLSLALLVVALLIGGALGAVATTIRSGGPAVDTERLDDGQQQTVVEDLGITITLTGPTTAVVDRPVRVAATVEGAETWQWIGPDGALHQGRDAIELTPRTPGRSTVRLQAFDEQGRPAVALHRIEVTDEAT